MKPSQIRDPAALDAAFEAPLFLLFKHSLACGVSGGAFAEYGAFLDAHPDTATAWIDVVASRDLAREVARRTDIPHESPQALLLRHGEVLWHASHWTIRQEALEEALRGA